MKKKKRHLKKWVKVCLFMMIILSIVGIINQFINQNQINNNSSKKIKDKKDNKKTNNKSSSKKEEHNNLERFDYKEGFYYEKLSDSIKEKITGHSFPKEFDKKYTEISYDDLRYLKVKYKDFSGNIHDDGELIVNKDVAEEVLSIFYELFINNYSLAKIKLVEEYNASDELSMQDRKSVV